MYLYMCMMHDLAHLYLHPSLQYNITGLEMPIAA